MSDDLESVIHRAGIDEFSVDLMPGEGPFAPTVHFDHEGNSTILIDKDSDGVYELGITAAGEYPEPLWVDVEEGDITEEALEYLESRMFDEHSIDLSQDFDADWKDDESDDAELVTDGGVDQSEAAVGHSTDGIEATLSEGAVIVKKESGDEYQLVDDDAFGVVATKIGDRRIADEQSPEVGDDCIRPNCDGTVEDVNGRLWCSEGCLEWFRTTPAQGDKCDKYGDKCDGQLEVTVNDDGSVNYECDTCSEEGWSAEITWRESWLPYHDRSADTESDQDE